MYTKIMITGGLEVLTGLHIGGSDAFSAIGAVDSPVVRNTLDRLPMIPGSSLKGKMRTLLARLYNEKIANKPEEDDIKIIRLFGSSEKDSKHKMGRLLFTDMWLSNEKDLRKRGADSMTEVKFENTINRLTAEANPRQIERVIRGSEFDFYIIYEISEPLNNADELLEDFTIISEGFRLLQYDYLGGHGSRGYGRVSFFNLAVKTVVGEMADDLIKNIGEMLDKVGDVNVI